MNYSSPQLLDELAAQYALGTLRGSARLRFERLCRLEPAALSALHRWEDKLVGLMAEVKPVAPPHSVWLGVQKRLGHGTREQSGFLNRLFAGWNRAQLAAAAGVAAIILTFAIVTYVTSPEPTQQIALIQQEWRVAATRDGSKLVIKRTASTALDAARDYELWAVLDSGAAPISLGLLPKSGSRNLTLTAAQRLALAQSSKIAVSLEPIGGSPTGSVTGPVLFVADVTKV